MTEERLRLSHHWMILRCGVKIWNRWVVQNPDVRPDLTGVDLSGARLEGAKLRSTDLEGAKLDRADLTSADLVGANLKGAKLERANLEAADLWSARLTGAVLNGANLVQAKLGSADLRNAEVRRADLGNAELRGADFRYSNLRGSNFEGAHVGGAYFGGTYLLDVDLRNVDGLRETQHRGPSPLSFQTLEMNQGQLPETFLRGCGLKEWEILATKLHDPNLRPDEVTDIGYQVIDLRAASPIVPLSLFISYSHEDQRFVEKLEARFDKDGIRYWRDVHDLISGPIEAQVDRAIGLQRATLLILSEDSVDSDWVEYEARRARQIEKERRKGGEGQYVLCPVALDDSWKACDWPARLREQIQKYNILDFSWSSDLEFETQYEKLKAGLGIYYADQASGPKP